MRESVEIFLASVFTIGGKKAEYLTVVMLFYKKLAYTMKGMYIIYFPPFCRKKEGEKKPSFFLSLAYMPL